MGWVFNCGFKSKKKKKKPTHPSRQQSLKTDSFPSRVMLRHCLRRIVSPSCLVSYCRDCADLLLKTDKMFAMSSKPSGGAATVQSCMLKPQQRFGPSLHALSEGVFISLNLGVLPPEAEVGTRVPALTARGDVEATTDGQSASFHNIWSSNSKFWPQKIQTRTRGGPHGFVIGPAEFSFAFFFYNSRHLLISGNSLLMWVLFVLKCWKVLTVGTVLMLRGSDRRRPEQRVGGLRRSQRGTSQQRLSWTGFLSRNLTEWFQSKWKGSLKPRGLIHKSDLQTPNVPEATRWAHTCKSLLVGSWKVFLLNISAERLGICSHIQNCVNHWRVGRVKYMVLSDW